MQFNILYADTLIGSADVIGLDPPMGVAICTFSPGPAYETDRHANVVDGDYIDDKSANMRVKHSEWGEIECSAVSIQDFPTLGEFQLDLLGITKPPFDEIFGDHPHYREYFGK